MTLKFKYEPGSVRPLSEWQDPDEVGQSEYRALHELVESVEDSCRHEGMDEDEIRGAVEAALIEIMDCCAAALCGREPFAGAVDGEESEEEGGGQ